MKDRNKLSMVVKTMPITDIASNPRNIRTHNRRNIEGIKASLQRFGQQKPIVIGRNGIVYAGNGTLQAATELGWTTVDCVYTELSEQEAEAFGIADNRLNELSDWDPVMLAEVLGGFDDESLFGAVGFDDPEIADLLSITDDPEDEKQERRTGKKKKDTQTVRILIHVDDIGTVERALELTGLRNRADALLEVCKEYEKRQHNIIG